MEKIARVFPRAGPDPSTRQQPFLCMGKGVVRIWFTDRFCPTVESEMVYQELLPSPCSHQKKETEKKVEEIREDREMVLKTYISEISSEISC